MKRFVLLDTTPIPDNGGALCLFEYGEDFVIKIQGGDGGQLPSNGGQFGTSASGSG